MNRSYLLAGTINSYPVKTKYFRNSNKALKYLEKLLDEYNVQIENVYSSKDDVMTTYVANNYSRFMLTKLK